MTLLCIKTDSPEASIAVYEDDKKLAEHTWPAHKQLSNTLHHKVEQLLSNQAKTLDDIDGIIVFKGPGSFTGLRIGLSYANTLSYSLGIPIIATASSDWLKMGVKSILSGHDDRIALPDYGAEAHITQPRK